MSALHFKLNGVRLCAYTSHGDGFAAGLQAKIAYKNGFFNRYIAGKRVRATSVTLLVCSKMTVTLAQAVDRKKPPPPGGFPIYYVPSSRTVCKRTFLEEPGTNLSRGVLLHTVLDEGT